MGDRLTQLHALCKAERWYEAFDYWRAYPTVLLKKEPSHRDAWLAFLCGETYLLHNACAQAVAGRQCIS